MKIVINDCFGGFGISAAAKKALIACGAASRTYRDYNDPEARTDPDLIRIVEQMGESANGQFSKLKIVEVPDDVKWHIHKYDGLEHVAENHRTWD